MQNAEHNAFKRDLVVLDCQPPSKMVMLVSSIMAILLPCRYTVDTPSLVTTWVLPEDQFLSALIAAIIWDSILRMESSGLLDFHRIHQSRWSASRGRTLSEVSTSVSYNSAKGTSVLFRKNPVTSAVRISSSFSSVNSWWIL